MYIKYFVSACCLLGCIGTFDDATATNPAPANGKSFLRKAAPAGKSFFRSKSAGDLGKSADAPAEKPFFRSKSTGDLRKSADAPAEKPFFRSNPAGNLRTSADAPEGKPAVAPRKPFVRKVARKPLYRSNSTRDPWQSANAAAAPGVQ